MSEHEGINIRMIQCGRKRLRRIWELFLFRNYFELTHFTRLHVISELRAPGGRDLRAPEGPWGPLGAAEGR